MTEPTTIIRFARVPGFGRLRGSVRMLSPVFQHCSIEYADLVHDWRQAGGFVMTRQQADIEAPPDCRVYWNFAPVDVAMPRRFRMLSKNCVWFCAQALGVELPRNPLRRTPDWLFWKVACDERRKRAPLFDPAAIHRNAKLPDLIDRLRCRDAEVDRRQRQARAGGSHRRRARS